jgi:hypothetical protein
MRALASRRFATFVSRADEVQRAELVHTLRAISIATAPRHDLSRAAEVPDAAALRAPIHAMLGRRAVPHG